MIRKTLPYSLAMLCSMASCGALHGQSVDSLYSELRIARSDTDSLRTMVSLIPLLGAKERIEPAKQALRLANRCMARLPRTGPGSFVPKVRS